MEKRTSYLAGKDHVYGVAVVEIVNNNIFHMRIIEGSSKNSITDLGVEYLPNGTIKKLKNSIMVLGDSHTDMIDKKLHDSVMDTVDDLNIETLVIHDVFHGGYRCG